MKRGTITEREMKKLAMYDIPASVHPYLEYLTFEKGEHICFQGIEFPYLLFLMKGKAKVSITVSNGRTLLVCFYEDKGILGDIEMMAGCPNNSTVQALSRVECAGIHYRQYEKELKTNIRFMNYIGRSLAEKLNESSMNSAWNQLVPLDERLCAYILMTEEQGMFQQNLTEIAELLGTSYRHLMRTLTALCEKQMLERKDNGMYRILDPLSLKQYAGYNYMAG